MAGLDNKTENHSYLTQSKHMIFWWDDKFSKPYNLVLLFLKNNWKLAPLFSWKYCKVVAVLAGNDTFFERKHHSQKDSQLSQNIWYFDKIKTFWKLMIYFCYFYQKNFFLLGMVHNDPFSNIFHWKSVKESKVGVVLGAKFGPN